MPYLGKQDSTKVLSIHREAPGLGMLVPGSSQSPGCSKGGILLPAKDLRASRLAKTATAATTTTNDAERYLLRVPSPRRSRQRLRSSTKEAAPGPTPQFCRSLGGGWKGSKAGEANLCDAG